MSEPGHAEALPRTTLDIARVAAASRSDVYLETLAGLAQAGGGATIAVLVGGWLVVGRLVDDRAIARELDRYVDSVYAQLQAQGDNESLTTQRQAAAGGFEKRAEEELSKERETMNRYGDVSDGERELHELPEDLARDLISHNNRVALTLEQAHVVSPDQARPHRVPVMRVQLREVAGWWLVQADEEGKVSFSFPSPD